MSNKITIATIQFRADAKGVNPTLDAMRQSSKDAHDEIDRLQQSLDKGIKTMKDVNGVDFKVADKIKEMTKLANGYDSAIRELMKGATALESVVKNIELGTIEKNSRAELKGAINAANSRLRSIRQMAEDGTISEEDLQRQRELNTVILESQKQLNNLDRDTKKVIETIEQGGAISEAVLNKEMKGLKDMLALIPKGTDEWNQYNAQLQQIEQHVAAIKKQEREAATSLLSSQNLGGFSEEQIRAAINSGKELLATYKTASPEAKTLADNIVRAEQYLKNYGVEAARAAAREQEQLQLEQELAKTMNKRLRDLKNLSADALAETRRYWEAQKNGAAQGTEEFNKAEAALKKIDGYQRGARRTELGNILGDPSKFGVAEVKNAVQEAEKLRDSVQKGIPVWHQYNKMVEQGKQYLDNLAKTEAAERIEKQMQSLTTISSQGLQEVKRYWETMVAGAAQGSTELDTYKAKLEQVTAEEKARNVAAAEQKVGILSGGASNLRNFSEAEVRQAIEAGNQLIKTYKVASPEAQKLAKNIVAAEEYLKQYGLEAERTARKEADAVKKAADERRKTDVMMQLQLKRGLALDESTLKSQQQYWQRLINDPKTAAASLKIYEANLKQVEGLLKGVASINTDKKGQDALRFFRGNTSDASISLLQEKAKDLKAYRDSLPRQTEAKVIAEIDGYLLQAGQAAQRATEQTMSFRQALQVSAQAGKGQFKGTVDQLNQAKKTLEAMQQQAVKGGFAWRRMQEGIERIEIELKNVGHLSKDVQAVLDKPKGKSFNELKQAVEQGRIALQSMRTETDKDKKAFDDLAAKIKAADQQMKTLAGSAKGTATAFDKAWSRLKTYVGLYMGAAVAIQKLTGTLGDLMELSDKMGEVRKTTGFTADEVGRLSENLKKMDVRTPLTQLMEVSAAAGQLGLKTLEDVQGFTEAANKLMIALPEMGKEAATEMMRVAIATGEVEKIRKQLQEGTIEGSSATAVAMEKIASTIDRLRATSASTAPEITDFVKRVGAVGAQSGITIDQVSALGSTISSLGMRVEMSATALSRMIPAIKNNAYQIGAMIGKTEEEIRTKFENGMGMEVIVDILKAMRGNVKGLTGEIENDSEKIEEAFESAGLGDIMKQLNQQGARAGIVFAGLSQNVDELTKQLGVASQAYRENTAIQKEFDKMNETTAAKWERLKNQLEEYFVSDTGQRYLGWIIDRLRDIIDLLAGDNGLSVAIRTVIVYVSALKIGIGSTFAGSGAAIKNLITGIGAGLNVLATGIGTAISSLTGWTKAMRGVQNATAGARMEWKKLDAAVKANVIGAVITVLTMFAIRLWEAHKAAKAAAAEVGRFNQQLADEKKELDNLFSPLNKYNTSQEERLALLKEINAKYGTYLGYMLSETSSAQELADAHALIAKRIKEEAYERRIAEKEKEIMSKHDEDLSAAYGGIESAVRSGAKVGADVQAMADMLKRFADQNLNNVEIKWSGGYRILQDFTKDLNGMLERLSADGKLRHDDIREVEKAVYGYASEAKKQHDDIMSQTSNMRSDLRGIQGAIQTDLTNNLSNLVNNVINSANNIIKNIPYEQSPFPFKPQGKGGVQLPSLFGGEQGGWQAPWSQQQRQTQQIPKAPEGWYSNINKKDINDVRQFVQKQDALRGGLSSGLSGVTGTDRENAESWLLSEKELEEYRKILEKNGFNGKGDKDTGGSPYGNYDKRVDPYEEWDANALVKRRKDMLERVKALANGADVEKVLSMDKKFMDEATRKGIKNMRDAIAWYNEERLKIQDELKNRNLTPTGDWLDPKKEKGSKKKPKTPESEAAIAELDRYYSERKELIEEARSKEEMTDAEYNRRLDALEQEHLQKRSDLRQTFTSKDKQFIQQFRQWWASVEELDEVSWETIEAEWIAAWERDRKYNNREAQKDLTAMQAIIVKQLKEIEAIIDKERPFNGITKNLETNLTKMELLFKDGVPEGDKFMEENTRRLTFLLKEAEDAYNLTFDQLAEDMRKNGLGLWADAIINSENADKEKRAIIAQLHTVYDDVQDAIKKEAAQVKKQVDIAWNDAILPNGKSIKQTYEQAISAMGIEHGRVSRANSLIGAGQASERVADKLAIKQMQLQLRMQEHYYNLIRKTGLQRIDDLKREAELMRQNGKIAEAERLELDAKHATMSLNLSLSKEQTELDKQREDIIARTEESEARLYKELREWGDLIASSLQSVMEASNAGNAEYYNELAKLNLTGKGGPGAGTYIVIENEGTEDAKAHYEYLDERQALERQREIEQQNAVADAWKKVMDDLNQKLSDTITDQLNAMLQNESIDANTAATLQNTDAIIGLANTIAGQTEADLSAAMASGLTQGTESKDIYGRPASGEDTSLAPEQAQEFVQGMGDNPMLFWQEQSDIATKKMLDNMNALKKGQQDAGKNMAASAQSTFAKMSLAANMYGAAYQAMTNDNLSTTQKFEMMALQAVGNYAINSLTAFMAETVARGAADEATVLGKLWSQLGWAAAPVFAIFTGLLGAAMGAATNAVSKSKSQIAQATGSSVGAGRLSTGMLTYAEGNVNEFTDPNSLTPGRSYNVDAADGKTYRAKYTGRNPSTHLTNGPEFHLAGEAGREMIIDAGTTRQITMNDNEIWRAIQTLSAGGSMSRVRSMRKGRGVRAFADGNMDEFTDYTEIAEGTNGTGLGFDGEMMAAFQSSIDKNNELLERALTEGIHGKFDVYGPGGLVDSYDRGKKNVTRHGERY